MRFLVHVFFNRVPLTGSRAMKQKIEDAKKK